MVETFETSTFLKYLRASVAVVSPIQNATISVALFCDKKLSIPDGLKNRIPFIFSSILRGVNAV